jgi:membrane protein
LELDAYAIIEGLYEVLPPDISVLVASFVVELSGARSAGVLSAALFFSVYNTTNGFRAIIRATNAAYGVDERREPRTQIFLSFALMILFAAALIIMLALLIVWRHIWGYVAALFALFVFTAFIYKLACAKPLPLKHILPGAAITVIAWVVTSSLFGFFTHRFTQLPIIYGSIAGVFLLILWLNAVSTILLIGNETNALLHEF